MKVLTPLIVFCLAIFSLASNATSQYHQGIDALFTNYMLKYNDFITNGTLRQDLPLYHENVTFVDANNPPSTVSAATMDERVERFLLNLKKDGVARVAWDSVDIQPLAENLALVRNVAIRFKPDGSVFNRVGATYMIQQSEQGWRIAAFSVHPANYVTE
ncbi:hypothetical protein [Alteromonas flava]|uniref:hypothetical protein n=1 Tax=Alteromonas flava TaxID=2048003 RepID=UPI000C289554|nr:hypothetical protein [Alteromonas flava]